MVARTRLDVTLNVYCLSYCTLPQLSMPTSFFLTSYQWGIFSPPFTPQGDVLSLTRVYLSFSPSFMTTVDFVSTLTSGYGSLFPSCIIPSFSFTSGNGTGFPHRESYFCPACHTYFRVSLLTNMLHFLVAITCDFLIQFYNKFCLVTDNIVSLLHFWVKYFTRDQSEGRKENWNERGIEKTLLICSMIARYF